MMFNFLFRLALGVSLIALGGCASTQPTRFYVLSSLPRLEANQAESAKRGVAVGIRPVALPKYLDRPQIVTRAGRNQLDLAEFDRWAEPLKNNFGNVIAENLSILVPTNRIAVFPWNKSTPIDYQLTVDVTRFEARASGDSQLISRWSILGKNGKKVILRRKSEFREPVTGGSEASGGQDYKATVSAMSRALESLSREIAEAIRGLSR
ncbi:MAG: membrane integrity-associated transporter subunit PqiC [Candidatus Binatia bacterium]